MDGWPGLPQGYRSDGRRVAGELQVVSPAPAKRASGFALPVTLLALVVIEILVAGAFLLGIYEQRAGWNTLAHLQASGVAVDAALARVVAWDSTWGVLAPGDSASFDGIGWGGQTQYRGFVVRLGDRFYTVVSEAETERAPVRGTIGYLVRVDSGLASILSERGVFRPY